MTAIARTGIRISAFDPKPLTWWRSRKDQIDMAPKYQRRGRLWSDTDKAYLIDSILNGFDIPKLYLADFTYSNSPLNRKRLPFAVIDGKQRFEAIFDFFSGRIVLNEDFRLIANPKLKLAGLGYRDLQQRHSDIAEQFDVFPLTVMTVMTRDEELIQQLFVRLNRSKPLTGAEIRNAMGGPVPEVVRAISRHEFFKTAVAFPVARGQDLNAAAKLLMFEFHGKPLETKRVRLDSFTQEAGKSRKDLELAGRRTISTLDDLLGVFLPKDRLLGSAGQLPVYYWFARSQPVASWPKLRDFLVRFEEARTAVRKSASVPRSYSSVANDLTRYTELNRSTNDETSHVERIKILSKVFAAGTGLGG